ncbi:unnamed protein product [Pedinophyceae sp. YPF-701]|nr:unnamed protein product [Pedinophyceae sp. YPF-701]
MEQLKGRAQGADTGVPALERLTDHVDSEELWKRSARPLTSMGGEPDARTRALQSVTDRVIMSHSVDPRDDLAKERAKRSFDVEAMATVVVGGPEKLARRRRIVNILKSQPWAEKTDVFWRSREDEYVGNLKSLLGLRNYVESHGLSLDDYLELKFLMDKPGGFELHTAMYIPTLESQGTDEQHKLFLEPALQFRNIGTYAQTELGHGTFVRGIESTATYDPETREFIMHSPTLTATKWWPGCLGKTSTHCVFAARLFTQGKDHGPHFFVVQIRDLETHLPLPGVTVGDIGPKLGYGGVDNGFLRLNHVRIPRVNMLMRNAKVTVDGRYVPPPKDNEKAAYGTMMLIRAQLVTGAFFALSRATTIATRYCSLRRQTGPRSGPETQILDYQTVSHVVVPLIATSYALNFMGASMMEMYHKVIAEGKRGEYGSLPELHALSSGMKALSTWLALDGTEAARRVVGGQGYSVLSGLPYILNNYAQNVTWEGDNPIVCLQTARFLVKCLVAVRMGKTPLPPSAAYLMNVQQELAPSNKCQVGAQADWRDGGVLMSALRHAATFQTVAAAKALFKAGGGQLKFEGAPWNNNMVALVEAAKSHSRLVIAGTFYDVLERQEDRLDEGTFRVLQKVCTLFALLTIEPEVGKLLESGYLAGKQATWCKQEIAALVAELRPEAVSLVDAFDYDDYVLNYSAIGRADGNVYHALWEMANRTPLNKTEVGPAWESVLSKQLRPSSRM